MHDVDEGDDDAQARVSGTLHPSQSQDDTLLVLLDDLDGQGEAEKDDGEKDYQDDAERVHRVAPMWL